MRRLAVGAGAALLVIQTVVLAWTFNQVRVLSRRLAEEGGPPDRVGAPERAAAASTGRAAPGARVMPVVPPPAPADLDEQLRAGVAAAFEEQRASERVQSVRRLAVNLTRRL